MSDITDCIRIADIFQKTYLPYADGKVLNKNRIRFIDSDTRLFEDNTKVYRIQLVWTGTGQRILHQFIVHLYKPDSVMVIDSFAGRRLITYKNITLQKFYEQWLKHSFHDPNIPSYLTLDSYESWYIPLI